MLGNDSMRAWYGPDHVLLAADRGAIGSLLISDNLFRCVTMLSRHCRVYALSQFTWSYPTKAIYPIGRRCSKKGCRGLSLFQHAWIRPSYEHPSTQLNSALIHCWFTELNQLTGIAAILTFPLDVEVVEAEEAAAKAEADGDDSSPVTATLNAPT